MDGITSLTETVNYDSKTRAVDSKTPVSFSIRIREVERLFVRDGRSSRREKHITVASTAIGFEIPSSFLAEEENCAVYVNYALFKTVIPTWIQPSILTQICKDAITEGKTSGFMVEAVRETYFNNCIDLNDYDSDGGRIPTEPDCPICLQEFGQRRIITKLRCCDHSFHRDCILTFVSYLPR